MKEMNVIKSVNQAVAPVYKRPYQRPTLQVFGGLRLLTQGVGSGGTDNGQQKMMSDRLCKEGVTRIGTHPLGIGLYLFNYKPEYRDYWGHGRQFGVMADEVEKVMPEAVSVHPDGYKMVNYAMLGISRNLH